MNLTSTLTVMLLVSTAIPALGDALQDGDAAFLKKDWPTAFAKYNEAALQGNARARWNVGMLYKFGLGVQVDNAAAYSWIKLAAEQNYAPAEDSLGDAYATGSGTTQDWSMAIHWYELAAAQGDKGAQYSLGDAYYFGNRGVVRDYQRAFNLYLLSAQQGNADAQYSLGFMSYNGQGTAQSYFTAANYYLQAANNGSIDAQIALGHAYKDGKGVPQDYVASTKYYRMAARQGNLMGLALLGENYFNGQGVERNFVKAYTFENLAAAQLTGESQKLMIKERDQAAAQLTPAQLAQAQVDASKCLENIAQCDLGDGPASPAAPSAATSSKPLQRQASATPPASLRKTPALESTGSGFFVSGAGHVVTNAHVVTGCMQVRSIAGPLKVVTIDGQSDLALLSTGKPAAAFAKLRGGRGDVLGESVVAVGFPLHGVLGADPVITTGVISSLAGLKNDRRNIQISAPVQPGNSGGPVVGSDGAIVGIVVSKLDAIRVAGAIGDIPQNVNFAVGVGTLQSFLNANGVPYALSDQPSNSTRSTSGIAAEAARYTVSIECWK